MQTGVLNVIGGDRLLSFDLYINVHADGSGHGRFVRALVCGEHRDTQQHGHRTENIPFGEVKSLKQL